MTGTRRRARRVALQALYEINSAGHDPEATLSRHLEEANLSQELAGFARELVHGAFEHRGQIDAYIRKFAPAWPVEQIPTVDRNILRLAIFEIFALKTGVLQYFGTNQLTRQSFCLLRRPCQSRQI